MDGPAEHLTEGGVPHPLVSRSLRPVEVEEECSSEPLKSWRGLVGVGGVLISSHSGESQVSSSSLLTMMERDCSFGRAGEDSKRVLPLLGEEITPAESKSGFGGKQGGDVAGGWHSASAAIARAAIADDTAPEKV